jgi:hypothetical protein
VLEPEEEVALVSEVGRWCETPVVDGRPCGIDSLLRVVGWSELQQIRGMAASWE